MGIGNQSRKSAGDVAGIEPRPHAGAGEWEKFPHQPFATRRSPFKRGRLRDQADDKISMSLGQQHRHRSTHRVADGDGLLDTELSGDRGGVVGHVFQCERLDSSQPTAMTAVIESDERPLLGELAIRAEELQVGRCGPPMEQQQRRATGVGVLVAANEELAAPVHAHDLSGRKPRQLEDHDTEPVTLRRRWLWGCR